ncbi:WXG100 family type VII secretion target [Phycicoccus sonneratiae]|uniref:PPE family protein n=1 Tax=Phycicoccus sonneratiae TaxID=2807628 RepID=A0ABS2CGP2_9MICO|nr:hypothetical protein [Phycicoccus sonneraticus]MBM6399048.1 hypothetical protein [Phycicoccus sonneraticus]
MRPDEGPVNPPLPADAGPNERRLYDIYGFSSGLVRMTADDWKNTADTVTGLASEVRDVIRKLQNADQPWSGPAAESAFGTLRTLAKQLDQRAGEITDVKKGLELAAEAADTARTAYSGQVRSISTSVDRSSYEHPIPHIPDGTRFDQASYDAAVAGKREQREQAAGQVLSAFDGNIATAAKQMPVAAQQDAVTIDPSGGGGGGGGGNYPTGGTPSGGGYVAPTGGGTWGTTPTEPPTTGPTDYVICTGYIPPEVDPPVIVDPVDPDPGVDLDGETTGTVTPGTPGSVDWAGTGPGGSSGGAGGIGGGTGAGAVGGGVLAGGAAMLGKGLLGKMGAGALGGAGKGALFAGGSSGATGRGAGAAGRAGAAGGAGRSGLVAGGQGGAAGRGSGGRGSGGVRGARGTGRYGVPKLGENGRGARGGVAAGSGAGGRGKKDKDGRPEDVDFLTHEDEETWFEGEDDATPPVWR